MGWEGEGKEEEEKTEEEVGGGRAWWFSCMGGVRGVCFVCGSQSGGMYEAVSSCGRYPDGGCTVFPWWFPPRLWPRPRLP